MTESLLADGHSRIYTRPGVQCTIPAKQVDKNIDELTPGPICLVRRKASEPIVSAQGAEKWFPTADIWRRPRLAAISGCRPEGE